MELRSCTHMHFINASRGGKMIKILNRTRGKPVLKFKNVKDVCEDLDSKNGVSFPSIPPKDEFRGVYFDDARVKSENTNVGDFEKITDEPGTSASVFDCSDGGNSDLDGFGNMTLMQMKEVCKAKKRKRSKCIDLTNSPIKQEDSKLQTNEEDCDLLEPLSILKSKLSKKANAKTKSKRRKCCVSPISQSAIITFKSEPITSEHEFLAFNQVVLSSENNIKEEIPETAFSDFQNRTCFADDTSMDFGNQLNCYGAVANEMPVTAAECVSSTGWSNSSTGENHSCIVYEPCYDKMEYDPMPLQIVSNSCWDIVEADYTNITSYECLDFTPASESEIKEYITNSVHPDLFTQAISSKDDHAAMHDSISFEDVVSHQINSETRDAEGPDACVIEADIKGDLPSNLEANANSVTDCLLGSASCLVSGDLSMSKEEEQSQMSDCADAKRSLSPEVVSYKATDELTTAACGEHEKQQRPQRLFQARKAISPASQEKLCKAMQSVDLHDATCKEKLLFRKQTESTNQGAEGKSYQIRRPKFFIAPQTIRNSKNEKIISHPRGIPKASNGSQPAAPRFSTGCTSIRSCSESAIAFSQRQMHDIECITTKLTNELQTMKEIAEERLVSGPYPTTSLKYKADEVRMAIQNVTRVEASAKKLLSMMSRDCNRFCKIMKMADQNGTNASEDVGNSHTKTVAANKERKKITFADEAGEKLCHVKVFENEMISSSVTGPDQDLELLVK